MEPGSGRNKKRQDIRQGSRNWQKQPGYKTGHSQAETGKTEQEGIQLTETTVNSRTGPCSQAEPKPYRVLPNRETNEDTKCKVKGLTGH